MQSIRAKCIRFGDLQVHPLLSSITEYDAEFVIDVYVTDIELVDLVAKIPLWSVWLGVVL